MGELPPRSFLTSVEETDRQGVGWDVRQAGALNSNMFPNCQETAGEWRGRGGKLLGMGRGCRQHRIAGPWAAWAGRRPLHSCVGPRGCCSGCRAAISWGGKIGCGRHGDNNGERTVARRGAKAGVLAGGWAHCRAVPAGREGEAQHHGCFRPRLRNGVGRLLAG